MMYAITNAETGQFIAITENEDKDPMKECCFTSEVLHKMYDYAMEHTDLGLTFDQFCNECRAIERYVVYDDARFSLEQLKDIMRNQACFPNLYGHFYLVLKED